MTSRFVHIAIGLAISAIALFLALRGVHWHEVGDALTSANYLLILLAAVLVVAGGLFRAFRWRLLLASQEPARLWYLFGSLNVAYLVNGVLPLQLGDLGRAYVASELCGLSSTRTLSTIVLEKLLDILTLLFFLLVLALVIPIPAWVRAPALIAGSACSVLAVMLVIAASRREMVLRLIDRLLPLAPAVARPKLKSMAGSAIDGLHVLARPRKLASVVVSSLLIWLLGGLMVFVGLEAFNIDKGFGTATFVLITTTFGFLVPSSPGSFGVYHAIAIATLTNVFDVDRNVAVSYALVAHFVSYLPPVAIGAAFLAGERRLWREANFTFKLRELVKGAPPEPSIVRVAHGSFSED